MYWLLFVTGYVFLEFLFKKETETQIIVTATIVCVSMPVCVHSQFIRKMKDITLQNYNSFCIN